MDVTATDADQQSAQVESKANSSTLSTATKSLRPAPHDLEKTRAHDVVGSPAQKILSTPISAKPGSPKKGSASVSTNVLESDLVVPTGESTAGSIVNTQVVVKEMVSTACNGTKYRCLWSL
jgi:hypothetical protein